MNREPVPSSFEDNPYVTICLQLPKLLRKLDGRAFVTERAYALTGPLPQPIQGGDWRPEIY